MSDQLSLLTALGSTEPHFVVFDIETQKSADEVGGWNNISAMGLAVACCYDSKDQQVYVYEEADIAYLVEKLRSAEIVVGFNHLRFDYLVMQPYTETKLHKLNNFDILHELTRVLGHRLSLNQLAAATLKKKKSADGLQSLKWFKEGKLDLIKDYCKQDVEVTRDVFLHGVNKGHLFFEKGGQNIPVNVQWNLSQLRKGRTL